MSKKVRRLFDGFQPEHYQLFLDPDRASKVIRGQVTIRGQKKGRPSQRLTFHQHGLKINAATITRHDKKGDQQFAVVRINLQGTADEVRLHAESLLYPGSYTVTLEFQGKVQDSMHGVYVCNYEIDDKKQQLVASQFESHHAREAFPCIDEPEAKAIFDLTLASPLHETALSNTPAQSQTEADGKLHTTFSTTPRMSTYLLAFVYGDMHSQEATTKDGVLVRTWATRAHTPEALEFGLDVAKRGIEFFNDYYGVAYPLTTCELVALPDFSVGAMENWGLITFREQCLLAEPATTSQSSREYIALVVCHELSHQWFGNLVTMKWWDDLWLNESFANVMEYLSVDALYPDWHILNSFIASEGLFAIRRDSLDGVQAVKTEVRHPDEINSIFDPAIVYAKGGRLLYMLMQYIGEADFRKGLTAYFTKHAYRNTTGEDLWAALAQASGKDVAAFMRPWLDRPGLPVLHVEQTGKQLAISQSHFCLNPAKADQSRLWPVPLLASSVAVPPLLEKQGLEMELPDAADVRLNCGAVGHYLVHYVRPEQNAALAGLAGTQKLSEAERLMLLSDSTMLARSGVQSFLATMELLQHYATETSEPVWDIMALIIADGRRFIDADPAMEPQIKLLIRTLIQTQYKRLGWQERAKEDSHDTKLRATILGLGVYAEHPAILTQALALFEAYKKDAAAVPSELRGIVFAAAVRHAAKGAFAYLLALEESTSNVDLKAEIASALCVTQSTSEAKTLLQRIKDTTKVRPQDADRWVVYLMRNRHTQQQAWDWLRANWPWIETMFKSDKSYDNFPRYAASALNTRIRLQEFQTFFDPLKTQTGLVRNITLGIEEIETRVAWIERDLPAIQQFFKSLKAT